MKNTMKYTTAVAILTIALSLTSCGRFSESVEQGKKFKCKAEELDKTLIANPGDQTSKAELDRTLEWIQFHREESGDAEAFDKALAEHKCE